MLLAGSNENKTIVKLIEPPATSQPGDSVFLEVLWKKNESETLSVLQLMKEFLFRETNSVQFNIQLYFLLTNGLKLQHRFMSRMVLPLTMDSLSWLRRVLSLPLSFPKEAKSAKKFYYCVTFSNWMSLSVWGLHFNFFVSLFSRFPSPNYRR
jgi:hypothetical protein